MVYCKYPHCDEGWVKGEYLDEEEFKRNIKDTIHRERGICNRQVVEALMKLFKMYHEANIPVDMTGKKTEPYREEEHRI